VWRVRVRVFACKQRRGVDHVVHALKTAIDGRNLFRAQVVPGCLGCARVLALFIRRQCVNEHHSTSHHFKLPHTLHAKVT
jgi:hypothetical protein